MLRTLSVILGATLLVGAYGASAGEVPSESLKNKHHRQIISMTHEDALMFAKEKIAAGKLDDAEKVLLVKPYDDRELEIERLYLLAQIATLKQDYDKAIDIYYYILNYQPDVANIRYRLAILLLKQEAWLRADYHFRMTLAQKDLPPPIEKNINAALRYIRQNKNWNFWLSFGIAPDNNVNNTTSGEQCIMTAFGMLCDTLDKPEKSVGFNVIAGGNYDFKLTEKWRLRQEAMLYTARYKQKKYDDVYLHYALGPRYVYERGDVFLGASLSRRYLGHKAYNYAAGAKLAANYDLTKQLSSYAEVYYTPTHYDDYGKALNGYTTGARMRLFYALNPSMYFVFKTGYEYEKTKDRTYTNYRNDYALGFGMDMAYGFHVYVEPMLTYMQYKGPRWTVKDYQFMQIKEHDVTQRYSISLSNRNIEYMGMMPVLTYSYTDKSSNIWQREYQKSLIELSIQKRF